eukprot:gene8221-818_t
MATSRSVLGLVEQMGLSTSWRIAASEFEAICSMSSTSPIAALQTLLPLAQSRSVMPISRFRVGAVALGRSGSVYFGANIEIPHVAINQCIHAEQFAIANAFLAREKGIEAIAITAMPCGHCRQFLCELPDAKSITVHVSEYEVFTLNDLLPHNFGPGDLLSNPTDMLSHANTPLKVTRSEVVRGKEVVSDETILYAAIAAERSYSPFTSSHAGIAIKVGEKYITGSYLENSAFNPALPAAQVAYINALLQGISLVAADEVAYTEHTNTNGVSHLDSTQSLLTALGVHAPFTFSHMSYRNT